MITYLKGLTPMQWFASILAILGVLGASTVQLTDLLGPALAKTVVTISNLAMTIMSAIMVPMTGQTAQVRAVQAMPGVDKIVVNEKANPALATLAVDPVNPKIEATAQATATVIETAKGES